MSRPLPKVIADGPLSVPTLELLDGKVELLPWETLLGEANETIDGIYTFGHPRLDGVLMDKVPNIKVISNYGVGVDHIVLEDAKERGIPVSNTPGVLDGATADLGFCLLMMAARRLGEGIRLARSPEFSEYQPARLLGREVHGAKLGIVGLGRIGQQVARRANGFDMEVSYYNRNRRIDMENILGISYQSFDELLSSSDYVMLCVPLSSETNGLIGAAELRMMSPNAILVNIARGGVVDTDALTLALTESWIYGAALDVTEPEPLPRDHPLLNLDNAIITPHLGSATVQTRQKMSELSVKNLLLGLAGEPLSHPVL